jgi:hypothetical protein
MIANSNATPYFSNAAAVRIADDVGRPPKKDSASGTGEAGLRREIANVCLGRTDTLTRSS